MNDDEADKMINDVVDAICEDNTIRAAEALEHMAQQFSKAGLPKKSFVDMRHHVINYTIERLGKAAAPLIHMKLQIAEQELMRTRRLKTSYYTSGNSNIIIN
jgi:hypothetical protein